MTTDAHGVVVAGGRHATPLAGRGRPAGGADRTCGICGRVPDDRPAHGPEGTPTASGAGRRR